ncbi:MAG: trehalose operon repressor [Lactobacillus sp.]
MQSKYDLIAQDLLSKIKHQQYAAGTFLPSEKQLGDLYSTSRETIRKALGQLEQQGLIQKIRGKGSIILDLQRLTFPISGIESFKELTQHQKLVSETQVLKQIKTMSPSHFNGLTLTSQPAHYLERLRLINQVPVILDCDYLLSPLITTLPKTAGENSLYEYIEQELGLTISYASKVVTVERMPEATAKLLGLGSEQLAVVVRSLVYLEDTTLFQLTISIHRPDQFKFVDFARRTKVTQEA